MKHETMKDFPEADRPDEKCLTRGPASLSDTELLSVILRTGVTGCNVSDLARKILNLHSYEHGLPGILRLSLEELKTIRGIGNVKAAQILCIGELSRRIARSQARKKIQFSDSSTVADYYMEHLRHEEQETVFCMMLNTKNAFLGDEMLSRGTVNLSLFSPRELFLKALSHHAVSVILVHNHPSGDPTPSQEDIAVTQRIASVGEILGIRLLDHIVIGDRCYVSLKEEGCL